MALFFRVNVDDKDQKHGKFYFPVKNDITCFPYDTPGIRPKTGTFEQKSRFRYSTEVESKRVDKKYDEGSKLPYYLKEYVNLPHVTRDRMAYDDKLCISVLSTEEEIQTKKSKAKRWRKIKEEMDKEQFKSSRTFLSSKMYCRTPLSFHLDARTRSPHYSLKEHHELPKIIPLKLQYSDVPASHLDEPIHNESGRSMHFVRSTVLSSKDKNQLMIYSAPQSGSGVSAPLTGDLKKYSNPLAYASAVRATAPNVPKSKYVKSATKSYARLGEYLNTGSNESPRNRVCLNPLRQRLYEAEAVQNSEIQGYVASSELPAKVVWTAKTRNYQF